MSVFVPTKHTSVSASVVLTTYDDTLRPQNQLKSTVVVWNFKIDVRFHINVQSPSPKYELNMIYCPVCEAFEINWYNIVGKLYALYSFHRCQIPWRSPGRNQLGGTYVQAKRDWVAEAPDKGHSLAVFHIDFRLWIIHFRHLHRAQLQVEISIHEWLQSIMLK